MKFVRLAMFCLQWFVYIHRHTSIVETSHCGVPRQEMPISRFTFSSLSDVRSFWTTLRNESFSTPAGLLLLMITLMTAAVVAM